LGERVARLVGRDPRAELLSGADDAEQPRPEN